MKKETRDKIEANIERAIEARKTTLGDQYTPYNFFKGAESTIKKQLSFHEAFKEATEPLRLSIAETKLQIDKISDVSGVFKSIKQLLNGDIKRVLGVIQNHKDLWIENYNKDYKWFIFHGVSIEQYQTIATGKLEGELKGDKLNEAIDIRFLEIYTEDDFLLLKNSLDTLKTSEWGEEIAHIIDFANEDIEKNYVAILPFLYMMIERKIRAYKKYKFNMYSLAETIEEIEDDITSSITLGLQDESSNIILESIKATKSDKFGGFKRHVKEESRAFNRNSVMHGSISPKYWDFIDFVKLVNATTFMLLWMPAYTGYDELE